MTAEYAGQFLFLSDRRFLKLRQKRLYQPFFRQLPGLNRVLPVDVVPQIVPLALEAYGRPPHPFT